MNETKAIKVEGLSKLYKLGVVGYGTLKDDLKSFWARVRGKEDPNSKIGTKSRLGEHGEFWALREINFEIEKGDRIGIIGRNGAGKSTLLKLLSRITAPTRGKININGRVASLLEVGTGFHPELTGRENIFLNGAILGMKRREILNKFDEIVAFSGVSEFIDTPVKRYSSGMYVRLAFSVAAHLDSDTLIVDEVLAVGDAEFQKKCIGKMEDVSRNQGRTILFVSHNIGAIQKLCSKGIYLDQGMLKTPLSDIQVCINDYLNLHMVESGLVVDPKYDHKSLKITEFSLANSNGKQLHDPVDSDSDFGVKLKFFVDEPNPNLTLSLFIYSEQNDLLFVTSPFDHAKAAKVHQGENEYFCPMPKDFFNLGTYRIEIVATILNEEWILEPNKSSPSIPLKIKETGFTGRFSTHDRVGLIAPKISWEKLK